MVPRDRGFTLIELMIVVAIIGILAAIAVPKFAELIRKSNEGSTRGNLGSIRSALSVYYADMEGQYPGEPASLTVDAKYLRAIPTAKTPPHHPDSNLFCTSMVAPGCTLGMAAAGVYDASMGPIWVYWEKETSPMLGPTRTKGDLWIGCAHTDSKGKIWSEY